MCPNSTSVGGRNFFGLTRSTRQWTSGRSSEAKHAVAPFKGSSYRIGYFSDNEIGWWNGALFGYYLLRSGANHTKRALVALIRHHYSDDWLRFAGDFEVTGGISSFEELLKRGDSGAHLRPGGNGIRLVREWTAMITRRYYDLVQRAVREADPAALIFSDRVPSYYDPDAVRAMAPFVDAVATNYDVDSPDRCIAHYYFDGLRQLTGNRPVVVSEWYFAAQENRTGNLNNGHLMTARTQAERAPQGRQVQRAISRSSPELSAFIGSIYDEPKGGRPGNHENYDFGLVDADGRPYEQDSVAALTEANRSLAGAPSERVATDTHEGGRADSNPRG